jgi:flagellar FliL protein
MSAKPPPPESDAAAPAKGGKKKLVLLAVPLILVAVAAGLWFSGIGPKLLGKKKPPPSPAAAEAAAAPVFVDLPDIVANLASTPRHQSYIKLKVKVELAKAADQAAFTAALPRVLDLLQTYLRDMRPDELRGSAGTYRLREELIARANIAVAPAHVNDVLFTELLIQ